MASDAERLCAAISKPIRNDAGRIIDFQLVWANDAAMALDGRHMSDFTGKTVLSLFPAMKMPELFDTWIRVVETGHSSLRRDIRYDAMADGHAVGGWYDVQTDRYEDGCIHVWREVSDRNVHHASDYDDDMSDAAARALEEISSSISVNHLPMLDNATVGACHRPADGFPGLRASGDWYDVFTAEDRLFFALGDVSGHGFGATRWMAQVRDFVRAYGRLGMGPAEVLSHVNTVVHDLETGITATAVCASLDLSSGVLEFAQAGHPPVLQWKDDDAQFAFSPEGVMLGASRDASFGLASLQLEAGGSLLFYSDGLVETREEALTESLKKLRMQVRALAGLDPQTMCDRLVANVDKARLGSDDVCALAVRWEP